MNRRARKLVDLAEALRRAHSALGEAIAGLRRVSLRAGEEAANRHRLGLAEAQVFEARYHLGAARSLLAVGLGLQEPARAPRSLLAVAQVIAARRAIARLEEVRASVAHELRALAHRAGDPDLARLADDLPPERLALPLAEVLLYGGVVGALLGVGSLLAGLVLVGAIGAALGLLAIALAAEALVRRRTR